MDDDMDLNFLNQNGVNTEKALDLFGDVEIYNETFKDYLDGIDDKKSKLDKFKNEANWPDYAIFAHSIKSDARYLGFEDVASECLKHEMAGKEGNQHFIESDYNNLLKSVDYMTNIVTRYLNGEKASNNIDNTTNTMEFINIENEDKKSVILVADDSNLITNFISRVLKDDYDLVVAIDGKDVIDKISSNKYDIKCLLLDLNMPNVDGFQVLEYLKNSNNYNNIPVSIITGEDSKDGINKAFTYNIVDMLVKPFSKDELLRVVNKTINIK
jgi:CheY-like chemotaxis protein